MLTGWRGWSIVALVALAAGCGAPKDGAAAKVEPKATATPVASLEDRLRGYPDLPGSKEALEEFKQAQEGQAPEKRLAAVLAYAKEPAGVKLFEAELARRKDSPADVQSLIAAVRAEAPGTPVAASALVAELDGFRRQDPAQFLTRCEAIADSPTASEGEKAVVLFKRATFYRDNDKARLAAVDALRFWSGYPEKVRRMSAAPGLAAMVRGAGYLCEADMLETSDEQEAVALALYRQFAPWRDALDGGKAPEKAEPYLAAYLLHAAEPDVLAATAAEAGSAFEKAQFLGRLQRLVAYEGDLERVVGLSQEYTDLLRGCIDGNTLPDDSLALACAQTGTMAECLRRMLADLHFVRSTTAKAAGAAASMRSEQVLAGLSGLSLDLADRRCAKGQIDEDRLAQVYSKHVETLKTINDSDNSIKAYRRYVEGHPKSPAVPGFLNNIAETYRSLGALDSAADTFKEIFENHPEAPECSMARLNRVVCLYQREAYEQAYEEGTAACAAKPDDPNTAHILLLCGLSEAAMGLDDEAGNTMNDIVTRFPASIVAPQAVLWLASRALSLQRYDESKRLFQDLVDRYPNSDAAKRAHEYLERLAKTTAEPPHAS